VTATTGRELRTMRWQIFAVTWLAYAGFYLCRKNWSVVMPILMKDLGYTKMELAGVLTGYLFIYMLGQFANSVLSDRFGPRLIVGAGLIISVCVNVAMGFTSALGLFMVLWCVNGYGQSTGWSGTIKNMATWFQKKERGVVMGWWCTCYVLGGSFATIFATYCATNNTILPGLGWKRAFWAPAIALFIIALVYILLTRNKPSDAGFSDFPEDDKDKSSSDSSSSSLADQDSPSVLREVLSNPGIWITGIMYFFLKMTRYSFLFWLPVYMTEKLGYTVKQAGYTSSVYEFVGFLGVPIAGYASDKLFRSRRFPVGSLMLFGLAIACLVQPQLASFGLLGCAIGIAFIGIMTYGPDALMSAPAAMDMGSQRGAATAAGVINGIGSCGPIFSPVIVAHFADPERLGWNGLFRLFAVCAVFGGVLLATKWNYGGQRSDAA